ncbi:uncharacterized protein [Atheta coriaria]|uniref:uncharacterized protein isoform X2 n=1 Tax=Dalotia coriaria TaxID=877792 RepID=UPI0031F37AE9
MRSFALLLLAIVYANISTLIAQRLVPPRQYHASDDDKDHENTRTQPRPLDDDYESDNSTDEQYLGDACDKICSALLQNAFCNPATKTCECQKKYPVKLTAATGCTKPKRLGEQCWYKAACEYYDPHASCVQVHHNAICACSSGYHSVSVTKPSKKMFCAEDLVVMTTDFSTLAGVVSGIAVLSGLICFVLKLFNQNLYAGRHRYGNAALAPPILFNSDGGSVPIIDRRLVSRASSQRTLASSRRPSSAPGCRGVAVSASRAGAARAAAILLLSCHEITAIPEVPLGSRRPSIASVHSSNSIRSYSMRRYEKEREQKEEREMQRRLAKLTAGTNNNGGTRVPPTPSPHSTDDLLPTLQEDEQRVVGVTQIQNQVPLALSEESASNNGFKEEIPSTSKQFP